MAVIGISGSYGRLSIGDEAILPSMLTSLRAARPDARDEFVVFSRNAEHTRAHLDVDRVIASRELSRDQVKPEIERLDLFLLGGGGILYDSEARIYPRDVCMAHERRIPTFAYAVGAGPLDEPEDRKRVRAMLDGMTSITVRDEVSKRLHVLIFALLSTTPCVALPYATKVSDFFAAAGVPAPAPVKGDVGGPLLAAIDQKET